jgi:hypothetical protein
VSAFCAFCGAGHGFGDHNFGYGMDLDAVEEWLNEP